MRHAHRPVDGTQRKVGSGLPQPHCHREAHGGYCSNGDRLTAQCECGAKGVWCPDHGWVWQKDGATDLR